MKTTVRIVAAAAIVIGGWGIWQPETIPEPLGLLLLTIGLVVLVWEIYDTLIGVGWLPPPKISLHKATQKAYEKTQNLPASGFAEESARQIGGEIHSWYAIAFASSIGVTLYGKKPPSKKLVEIPAEEINRCSFVDGARDMIRHHDKTPIYTDLAITRRDFKAAMKEIQAWGR